MSWRASIGRQLREIKVCVAVQNEGSSAGARKWVIRRTNEILMLNPHFRLFIREGDAIDPFMIVDYDWGRQETIELGNFTEKQVDDTLKKIVTDAMADKEYQASREPRLPIWLRRPVDVIDEIGRSTPRIEFKLGSNNLLSEEERAQLLKEVDEMLEEESAAAAKEKDRLERKSKRSFVASS